MRFGLILACLIGLLLAACAQQGPAPIATGDRYEQTTDFESVYKLGVGDKLRLTVFNEPSLSGEFSVGADGSLSLPLVGNVPVAGKQISDVTATVQTMLSQGYLRDPKISAEITAYRPFFILGEVKAPGQYPYVNGLTVLGAVATAQGFTPRAARGRVYIRRSGAAQEDSFVLTPDLRAFPGDTIRFGERYF